MANVSFTVGAINEREVKTRFGLKKAYDLIATDGTKYGFGFTQPLRAGISVGSVVEGEATAGSYGLSLDPKSARVGGSAGTPTGAVSAPSTPSAAPRKAYVDKVFPVPPTHGDMAIIRQNALTNAVATVADYVATQPAEKWPDLKKWRELVMETAYEFAKFSSGHREVEAMERLRGVGVSAVEINTAIEEHNAEEAA